MRQQILKGIALLLLTQWAACAETTEEVVTTVEDTVCGTREKSGPVYVPLDKQKLCDNLDSYRLFTVDKRSGTFEYNEGVVPYDLNSPLFSDYTRKDRAIWVPAGKSAAYKEEGYLDFPVGSIVAKTFSYPADLNKPNENLKLVETRILLHLDIGWKAMSYIWNDSGTEAIAAPLGATFETSWIHTDGLARKTDYGVPNVNQCKECHANQDLETGKKTFGLVGPQVKHINKVYLYADGEQNQLQKLSAMGYLTGVPTDLSAAPKLANPDDTTFALDIRARSYMDANCAHCHNVLGSAAGSGLILNNEIQESNRYGVCKKAARGIAGPAEHDISPGEPDNSVVYVRMNSDDTDVMMPRLGRTVKHTEGVELIRQWILQMPGKCTTQN